MRTGLACLVAVGVVGLSGCNRDRTAETVAAMNTSNLHRIANLYTEHQNQKGGRGPGSDAEFRDFIRAYDPNKLAMMGVDASQLDQLFTSELDNKPLKVRFRVGGGRGSQDPVVFEQEGKDGKKRVGFTGGIVQEVDDATYRQLWAGKAPAASGAPTGPAPKGRPTGPPPGAPTGPGQ